MPTWAENEQEKSLINQNLKNEGIIMNIESPELYTTLAGEGSDEFEEKRSVFIGHAKHITSEDEIYALLLLASAISRACG